MRVFAVKMFLVYFFASAMNTASSAAAVTLAGKPHDTLVLLQKQASQTFFLDKIRSALGLAAPEESATELPRVPIQPGCYVLLPTGCPKHQFEHRGWMRDPDAATFGADSSLAKCGSRRPMYNKWCGIGDTKMHFVEARPPPTEDIAAASTHGNGRVVFVGVFSSPKYRNRRDEVRKSWMQDAMLKHPDSPVNAKFILGTPETLSPEIDEEQKTYQDIVFLPIRDAYDNLPEKTLAFFSWFHQTQDTTSFAMKLDDDTFPNFNLILPALAQAIKKNPYVYFGGLQWHGPVQRDGKWAEVEQYRSDIYPVYAAGSGYALSRALVKKLEEVRQTPGRLQLLRNEDTTIGNFVHQENSVSVSVDYLNVDHDVFGCSDSVLFAMNLWPGELQCMWDKRVNGTTKGKNHEKDMCCRPLEDYGLRTEGVEKPEPSLLSTSGSSRQLTFLQTA